MCFLLFGKEMYISISNLLPVTYLEKQKERKSLAVSMFTAVGLNLLLIALCKCLGNWGGQLLYIKKLNVFPYLLDMQGLLSCMFHFTVYQMFPAADGSELQAGQLKPWDLSYTAMPL